MLAAAWSEQVRQLIAGTAVVNAELLKQQLVQAQYVPLNMSYQIRLLNNYIEPIAKHQEANPDDYLAEILTVMEDGKLNQSALD